MRTGLRFPPIGWIAAIGTLAAMAATLVVAAPGGAAPGPLKVKEVNFEAACILAPGVLNETGTIKVHQVVEGPETLEKGETFSLTNGRITVVTPANWGEAFFQVGSRSLKGSLTGLIIDAHNAEPPKMKIGPVPIKTPVTGGPIEFTAPAEGTLNLGPWRVTGTAGEEVVLSIDTAPGFKETSSGRFESTGEGLIAELTGLNEAGEPNIGPLQVVCTAPPSENVYEAKITGERGPEVTAVEPSSGSFEGGTTVQITGSGFEAVTAVEFELPGAPFRAKSFTVNSPTSITAVTPFVPIVVPESGYVIVTTQHGRSTGSVFFEFEPPPPPPPPNLRATYDNWPLSGSLTPKKLAQAISLPAGSTFSGSAEARPSSSPGPGKLTGSVSVPPFMAALKLFGVLPVDLGVTLTEAGPLEGSIVTNGIGNATLTIPAKLDMGITSIGIGFLKLPLSCATSEPIALELATRAVNPEELLSKGWEFSGTTTLPSFKCGGPFGSLVGALLSVLVSGPESMYALRVSPPAG